MAAISNQLVSHMGIVKRETVLNTATYLHYSISAYIKRRRIVKMSERFNRGSAENPRVRALGR